MSLPSSNPADHGKAAVMTRALLRSAIALGFENQTLAKVIDTEESTINRFARGEDQLQPRSKPWDLALMVVRLHMTLLAVVGNEELAHAWLSGYNHGLQAVPQELMATAEGLAKTLGYLESAASIS